MGYYIRIPNRLSFLKNGTWLVNLNLQAMKKNKISFETRFWAGFVAGNPFEAFDAIFDFAHLDYYKQNLSEAVLHC